jgi:hypothetical protein
MRIFPNPAVANTIQLWGSAYQLAITNAVVFLLFSSFNAAAGISSSAVHDTAAGLFMLGSFAAFYRMVTAGGALAAISFYVLGSGVMFGFGTVYSTIATDYVFQRLFGEVEQARDLPTINLMNSLSVTIVLMFALPVCTVRCGNFPTFSLKHAMSTLQVFRAPFVLLSWLVVWLQVMTFPGVQNLILSGILDKLALLPLLAIVLTFSAWRAQSIVSKLVVSLLILAMVFLGLVSASKTAALLPLVAAIAGLFLDGRRTACVVLVLIAALFYAPFSRVVDAGRSQKEFESFGQLVNVRIESIMEEGSDFGNEKNTEDKDWITRFAHGPYQSFLINEWEAGRPGNSLEDSWAALVPRIIWPEKPITTRFGAELYALIFNRHNNSSNQAPTYTGEAFWNYGWAGLAIVSAVLGLELGWFSRKWLLLYFGQSSDLGILFVSLPVILLAWSVETWIAASYVGGFITLVVLIKVIDFAAAFLFRRTPRRA